jgi:ATP-dependent Clp protease ATP-binding subunit ClpB
LTESVRQKPFSLILLDELEKADPDILTLFLQVLDDGRLTDSTGRVIDFTNSIIIATSNAGTMFIQEQIIHGISMENIRQQLIRSELKKYYRPEFLNRFDGIVVFRPLNKGEIKKVARLMLKRIAEDLEKRGANFRIEDSGLDALADVGFDPEFGARPMRRAIQDLIENKIADIILQGKLNRGSTVVLGEGAQILVE